MRRKTKPYSTYLNLLSQFLCLSSQLSTNRMRFSFIESSALWSCLLHVTFQLGKFCIVSSACFVFFFFFFFLDRLVKVKEFRSVFFVSFFRTFYRSAKCIPNFLRSTHLRELESPRQRIFGKVLIVLWENEVWPCEGRHDEKKSNMQWVLTNIMATSNLSKSPWFPAHRHIKKQEDPGDEVEMRRAKRDNPTRSQSSSVFDRTKSWA